MKWICFLLFIISCGDYSTRRRVLPQEEEASQDIKSFSTRLTNNLLISGVICDGSEVVTTEDASQICNEGNYLVTVDNRNFCTPEGCTEVFVEPVIASLDASGGDAVSSFFRIETNRDDETSQILESVVLRVRDNEEPRVIFR